jgi:hypothetical protein
MVLQITALLTLFSYFIANVVFQFISNVFLHFTQRDSTPARGVLTCTMVTDGGMRRESSGDGCGGDEVGMGARWGEVGALPR